MTRHQHVARGLAWGFLAAPGWTDRDLIAAAVTTLGYRYRWMKHVVQPVLATYHRPPTDRPYELSEFLLARTPLSDLMFHAAQHEPPVRVHDIALTPARMGHSRWPVPQIDDLAVLADLLELPPEQLAWAADAQGLQRRTPPGPLHLYRHHWVERPNTVPRLLESPTPLLRAVLRRMLDEVLLWVPVHPAAHGFVRSRSAVSNATEHLGAHTVLRLDLQTFFATITATRVNGIFRSMGYPESVAWTLTALTSHQTPVEALTRMPSGGGSSERHLLRSRLGSRHLPQGAPTSPALANLACFGLDRRLAGYAAAAGLIYTRYADDLTFSGDQLEAARLVRAVGTIIGEEGFSLNPAKTRVRGPHQRHEITGVVVNQRPNVPREYYDQLRAVLHAYKNTALTRRTEITALTCADTWTAGSGGSNRSIPDAVLAYAPNMTPSSGPPDRLIRERGRCAPHAPLDGFRQTAPANRSHGGGACATNRSTRSAQQQPSAWRRGR